jgi:CubicO group peptidase (beta-lactamase class C family)
LPARQAAPGLTDAGELEAFLDGLLAAQMEQNHVAGVTLSVVKDGQVFLAKGYGYADVAKRIPVDPEKTLFRVGSVSKLFTWTAVMQLVEQGKLDLDADVNAYLDFQIPATYPEPITLVHLLTHTPGFEDRGFGMAARTPAGLVPLGKWLARNIPTRVRQPGILCSYSNYGTALAGYIVERQSGRPYDEYVEENILGPLGMEHSTFRQPLPAELAGDMSAGYTYAGGAYKVQPFELLNVAPAGALSATATDMARFMIAHLQDGRYGGARILQEATARQMHGRLFTHDERLNGVTYGFWEMSQPGHRVIGHGGDTQLFHTVLALLPDEQVGFFASYNSASGSMLPQALFEAFLARYYPAPEPEPLAPPADFAARADRFSGDYRIIRMSYTTPEKLAALMMPLGVQATDDGTLLVTTPFGPQRFVEVEPLLFREVQGDGVLGFLEDEQGNISHAVLNDFPMMPGEKVAWYDAITFQLALLGAILFLFLTVVIAGPVGFFVNRTREYLPHQPALARLARVVLAGLVLLGIAVVVGVAMSLMNTLALMVGEPGFFAILPPLSIVLAALAAAMVIGTVLAWARRYWTVGGRLYYTVLTLAAVAFVWALYYWNLLGWTV